MWQAFGAVRNYVEPFFGSGAVLLGRPQPFVGTETINDKDGFLANFFRALKADPEAVAHYADNPVNECDMTAMHVWLVGIRDTFVARLMGDPDFFDAKVAGWWVHGLCCWIGSGWCSGKGPWQSVLMPDGTRQLVHLGDVERGVNRQLVHLGDVERGVNRKRVHLGTAGQGVNRKRVHLGDAGRGVNRQLVHLGNAGQGVNRKRVELLTDYFAALADRLTRVRVCCGDWRRVCGPAPTVKLGLTGMFLDPPYAHDLRDTGCYREDDASLSGAVREWSLAHGDDPRMRVILCGYAGEHPMPKTWRAVPWKAHGGFGLQGKGRGRANASREVLWLSPHCLPVDTSQRKPSRASALA